MKNETMLISQYRVVHIEIRTAIVKKLEIEEGDIIKVELPFKNIYSFNAVKVNIYNITKNLVEEKYSLVSFSNSISTRAIELEII
jgi:hypothetical protein